MILLPPRSTLFPYASLFRSKAHTGLLADVHSSGGATHTLATETGQKRTVAGDSRYLSVYKKSAFCGTCAKWPYRHAHWGQKRIQGYWLMFIVQAVARRLWTPNRLKNDVLREIVAIFAYFKKPPLVAKSTSFPSAMLFRSKSAYRFIG